MALSENLSAAHNGLAGGCSERERRASGSERFVTLTWYDRGMRRSACIEYLREVPVGAFLTVGDMPGSPAAARQCLAREDRDPYGLVRRVAHGLYWRADHHDPPLMTRNSKTLTKTTPGPEAVAMHMAGPGCGLTGYDALRRFELSWQIPAQLWLAVVGRPPQSPNGSGPKIRFFGRANEMRRELTFLEVTLLEALRYYEMFGQVEPWGDAMISFAWGSRAHHQKQLNDKGLDAQPPLPIERHDLIREVAQHDDPRLGRIYLDRLDQVLGIAADAYRFARLHVLHTP